MCIRWILARWGFDIMYLCSCLEQKGFGTYWAALRSCSISHFIEVALLFPCLPRTQGKIGLTLHLVHPLFFFLLFILEKPYALMECINVPHKRDTPDSVPSSLGEGCCMFHGEPLPRFKSRDFSPGPTGNGSKPASCSPASHQDGTVTELIPVSARVAEALRDITSTLWILKIAFNI